LHRAVCLRIKEDDASPLWAKIEPLLSIFVSLDIDAESPLFPAERLNAVPQDLLRALVDLAPNIASADLQARVLDAAWTRRVCDYTKVADAVTAYIKSSSEHFDSSNWLTCYTRLKRAIELGASIGTKNQPFLHAVRAVEEAVERAGLDDPLWLVHRLITLLDSARAGDPKKQAETAHEIAFRARGQYESKGVGNGLHCEREQGYLELEIRLRRRLKQLDAIRQLEIDLAEAFVRQADGVIEAKWPSAESVAEHFIGCAIKRLRQVGGEQERIEKLRARQEDLQRQAISKMKPMEFSVDATEFGKNAKAAVADKPAFQALVALTTLHIPPPLEALEDEARVKYKDSAFRALVPQTYLGPRGTVLAQHAGALEESGFELETMRVAHERQTSVGSFYLHPAAEQIRYEHGLDIQFFLQLCHRSPFVPWAREYSFARALAAGMAGDYELAAVILCPQLEHAIRELFFAAGIVTSTYPSSGIQNEQDLNTLLKHSRAPEIFGNELVYDLRVLLIEKAGGNLRNDLAHGILDDGAKWGAKVYVWWMCLFLIFHIKQRASRETDGSESIS